MAMDVGGAKGGVKSDINVTPLVDVVLVLLIIFMVVTPMLQRGKAVQLPRTENPAKKPDEKNQVLVVIQVDHEMYIDNDKISEAQFDSKIKETYERSKESSIVIKADNRLTYGDVKRAMLKIKEAGFQQVGLIATKKGT